MDKGNAVQKCPYSQLSLNGHLFKTDTWCWSRRFSVILL